MCVFRTAIETGEVDEKGQAKKMNPLEKQNRGRDERNPNVPAPVVATAQGIAAPENQTPQGINPSPAPTAGTDQSHERGVDKWKMNETAPFVKRVREQWDMRLAAGASGSTADLIQGALSAGLAPGSEELKQYALAILGTLGSCAPSSR